MPAAIDPSVYYIYGNALVVAAEKATARVVGTAAKVAHDLAANPGKVAQAQRAMLAAGTQAGTQFQQAAASWATGDLAHAYLAGVEHTGAAYAGSVAAVRAQAVYNEGHFATFQPLPTKAAIPDAIGAGFTLSNAAGLFEPVPAHLTKYAAFLAAADGALSPVRLQIVRESDDIYRRLAVLAGTQEYLDTNVVTRRVMSGRLLSRYVDNGITGITYANGRRVSLEAYCEMVGRTMSGHAAVQGSLNRWREFGYDLVRVSSHGITCPVCSPWEGQVLSQGGLSPKYPTVADAIVAGLWHPNCGHGIAPYIEGVSPSEAPDPLAHPTYKELEQKTTRLTAQRIAFDASQQQRAIERSIRRAKREVNVQRALGLDDRPGRRKVWALNKQLREHLDEHPYLTRKRWRETDLRKLDAAGHVRKPVPKPVAGLPPGGGQWADVSEGASWRLQQAGRTTLSAPPPPPPTVLPVEAATRPVAPLVTARDLSGFDLVSMRPGRFYEPLQSVLGQTLVDDTGRMVVNGAWKQVGPQRGSNVGGLFVDPDGRKWYVKQMSEDIARNEVLAARLYRVAGVEAAEVELVSWNGQYGVASRFIDDVRPDRAALRGGVKSAQRSARTGFGVDAWLANWDVVGLDFDNLLVTEAGNGLKAIRVDVGGSLVRRAQGARKAFPAGSVEELASLRNASINSQSASVFGGMTDKELRTALRKVARVSDATIEATVRSVYGSTSQADELIAALKGRKAVLKRELREVERRLGIAAGQSDDAVLAGRRGAHLEPVVRTQGAFDEAVDSWRAYLDDALPRTLVSNSTREITSTAALYPTRAYHEAMQAIYDELKRKYGAANIERIWASAGKLSEFDTKVVRAWSGSSRSSDAIAVKSLMRYSWGEVPLNGGVIYDGARYRTVSMVEARSRAVAQLLDSSGVVGRSFMELGQLGDDVLSGVFEDWIRARQAFVEHYLPRVEKGFRGPLGGTLKRGWGLADEAAQRDQFKALVAAAKEDVPFYPQNGIASFSTSHDTAHAFAHGDFQTVIDLKAKPRHVWGSYLENEGSYRWTHQGETEYVLSGREAIPINHAGSRMTLKAEAIDNLLEAGEVFSRWANSSLRNIATSDKGREIIASLRTLSMTAADDFEALVRAGWSVRIEGVTLKAEDFL